jgi:signal transduction histidine kinase/CheY-like chemotaxis protein/integral membrane sensor domain MASE1
LKLQRRDIVRTLVVALGYFVMGYASISLPFFSTSTMIAWPAAGIALAALIFWGARYFPGVLLGSFLISCFTMPTLDMAALIAVSNTFAATIPALVIRKLANNYPLLRFKDMVVFVVIGVLGASALRAIGDSTIISLYETGSLSRVDFMWFGWFMSDIAGTIVAGPIVLRLLNWRIAPRPLSQYGELAFISIASLILASAVHATPLISRPEFLFIFVSLPFGIWGAVRYGLLGAVLVNGLIVFDIILAAAAGNDMFGRATLTNDLSDLYIYIIGSSIGSLLLAAGLERISNITTRTRDGKLSDDVHRMRRALSVVIGIIGFGVSASISWYTYTQLVEAERLSTEQYRLAFEASLREELGNATDSLIAVRTLFDVHGSVSASTYDAMIAPWVNRRPGVAALEWAPLIERRERTLIEQTAALRGVDDFLIHDAVRGTRTPAAEKDHYFPVLFVFPRSGNEQRVGFDLTSEELRNRALTTALQTGNITLTPPVSIVQSASAVVTSLAFLAVDNRRDPGGPPLGVAVGVLRLNDMIIRAARVARIPTDFEVHVADLRSNGAQKLIYSNRKADYAAQHIQEEYEIPFNPNVSSFVFGYRDWTIVLHPSRSGFSTLLYWQPWAIFVFGSAISILLLIYLRSLNRTEKQIVDLVAKRTAELEQARASAELAMNQAQDADRAKSEFIAHMSHEFRSPMTSILGYSQLASDSLDKDLSVDNLRSYLGTIRGAGRHVLSLIGNILDISKIEAGKLVLEEVPFDLHRLCEEVASMMLVPAREQDNKLELDIDPEMPRWVVGDPVRLKQVMTNLVSNAIKFTKYSTIYIKALPLVTTDDNISFRISVRDEGIGIPKHKLETIFEAFAQVDTSTSRRYGGTGLGLAIVQRMVQTMGGTIKVDSTEGQGSIFWFDLILPRSTEEAVAQADALAHEQTETENQERSEDSGWNLLLVEDIEINRILAQKLLEQQGHKVTPASDGQNALDILSENDFDGVLMDLHMPVLDGMEATRQIRAFENPIKATIPILALTADLSNDNIASYRETGFDAYCTKPLDIGAINAELSRLEYRKLAARESAVETGDA